MSFKKDVKALREKSRYAFVCQKGKCWGVGDTPAEAYTHARTRTIGFLRKQAGDSSDDTAALGGWLDLIATWHPFIARITPEWCDEWKAKLDRLQNVMEIRVDPNRLTTRHPCSVKMLMHDDEMEFKRKCRAVVEEVTSVEIYTKSDAEPEPEPEPEPAVQTEEVTEEEEPEEEAEKEPTAYISVDMEWLSHIMVMLERLAVNDVVRVRFSAHATTFEWGCESLDILGDKMHPFSLYIRDCYAWNMHKMWKQLDLLDNITFGLTPAVISRIRRQVNLEWYLANEFDIRYFAEEQRLQIETEIDDTAHSMSFYVLPGDGEYMKHWEGE